MQNKKIYQEKCYNNFVCTFCPILVCGQILPTAHDGR